MNKKVLFITLIFIVAPYSVKAQQVLPKEVTNRLMKVTTDYLGYMPKTEFIDDTGSNKQLAHLDEAVAIIVESFKRGIAVPKGCQASVFRSGKFDMRILPQILWRGPHFAATTYDEEYELRDVYVFNPATGEQQPLQNLNRLSMKNTVVFPDWVLMSPPIYALHLYHELHHWCLHDTMLATGITADEYGKKYTSEAGYIEYEFPAHRGQQQFLEYLKKHQLLGSKKYPLRYLDLIAIEQALIVQNEKDGNALKTHLAKKFRQRFQK